MNGSRLRILFCQLDRILYWFCENMLRSYDKFSKVRIGKFHWFNYNSVWMLTQSILIISTWKLELVKNVEKHRIKIFIGFNQFTSVWMPNVGVQSMHCKRVPLFSQFCTYFKFGSERSSQCSRNSRLSKLFKKFTFSSSIYKKIFKSKHVPGFSIYIKLQKFWKYW